MCDLVVRWLHRVSANQRAILLVSQEKGREKTVTWHRTFGIAHCCLLDAVLLCGSWFKGERKEFLYNTKPPLCRPKHPRQIRDEVRESIIVRKTLSLLQFGFLFHVIFFLMTW